VLSHSLVESSAVVKILLDDRTPTEQVRARLPDLSREDVSRVVGIVVEGGAASDSCAPERLRDLDFANCKAGLEPNLASHHSIVARAGPSEAGTRRVPGARSGL
jgi:hypothetical protein